MKLAHAESNEVAGKAVSVSGKVLIREESKKSVNPRYLRVGDPIRVGEVLNSSSDASAKILMNDKTIVDIGASTLFKVDEYQVKKAGNRKVTLSMDYGKVRTSVNQPVEGQGHFRFRTKTATMGVRGTEFVVHSDVTTAQAKNAGAPGAMEGVKAANAAKTEITVMSGKVDVKSPGLPQGQAVSLTPGTQFQTAAVPVSEGGKAEPPQTKQLSKQELQTVSQDAKVADKTFVQSVAIDKKSDTSAPPPPPPPPAASPGGQKEEGSKSEGSKAAAPKTGGAFEAIGKQVDGDVKKAPVIAAIPVPGGPQGLPLLPPPPPIALGQPVSLKVVFVP